MCSVPIAERGALRGGIGVYMRGVWCHERNTHAFEPQRNALCEHYTPELAAQVTVTVSLLEVQWANDGPSNNPGRACAR